MKNNKKGFTLIEMLAVIAVVAILVTIMVPILSGSSQKAACATNAANLRGIEGKIATMLITNPECFADIVDKQENIDNQQTTVAALQKAVDNLTIIRDNAASALANFDPESITQYDDWQKAVSTAQEAYDYAASKMTHSKKISAFGYTYEEKCPNPSSDNYSNGDHGTFCKTLKAALDIAERGLNDAKSEDSQLYQAYKNAVNNTKTNLENDLKQAEADLKDATEKLNAKKAELETEEFNLYHYISENGIITLDDGTQITVPLAEKVNYKGVECPKKCEMALYIDIENGIIISTYNAHTRQAFAKLAEED